MKNTRKRHRWKAPLKGEKRSCFDFEQDSFFRESQKCDNSYHATLIVLFTKETGLRVGGFFCIEYLLKTVHVVELEMDQNVDHIIFHAYESISYSNISKSILYI